MRYRIQISHSVPCVSNKNVIEVNGFYSQGVLSGFSIIFDRQMQTNYSFSNNMARGAKGDCVTWVDVANP